MAEAIISSVVELIGNMLMEEGQFLYGVSDQVEQLQSELNRLQSFLLDAYARKNDEEIIKELIRQTQDLVYEADDVLETYAFRVASRRRGGGLVSILKQSFCILNDCCIRHKVGSDIQTVKTKISELSRSFQDYGLRATLERESSTSSSQEQVRQLRRTYSHVVEDDFVGLESHVEMLVEHLIGDKYRAVSIYGMGGLGKTTLARKLYNHTQVKRRFDGRVWVCVSQHWRKKDILQGILINLIPEQREEIEKWRDEELMRQLLQLQQKRRCLIVLDDIWSIDAWECIKQAFPSRKDGSKILLTTRNREVALQIGANGFHHEPRLLSESESWELLKMKALRERHHQESGEICEMKRLGKEMVRHCGGIPLAVVALGGILTTKQSMAEWVIVCKNIKHYLGRGNNTGQQGELQEILALSYDELPQKLKPCFLYLSRYSDDSAIDVVTLYQLWIAEGMISTKDRAAEESMLDVAERYLGELVKRCMVQVEIQDTPSVTRFKSCFLHDLIRDLCVCKAEEENFFLFVNYQNGFQDDILDSSFTHRIHRLAVHLHQEDLHRYAVPKRGITRHLRSLSFLVSGEYVGHMPRTIKSQFRKFKMLRVLAIEGLSPKYTDSIRGNFCVMLNHLKLPKAIDKLIHLRYLSLRGSSFWWLTSSLGNLQHLQTLDLRGTDVLRIPNVLWKLTQLRQLYFPHLNFSNPLFKLRLDSLTKLEILENFSSKFCHAKDLSGFTNLRALTALAHKDIEDVAEIIQHISNSDQLRCVSIEIWCYHPLISEKGHTVVRQLLSSRNLHRLKVRVPTGNLPKLEANFSSGLVELLLQRSHMEEDPMETLEKLPSLQRLILFYDSFIGKEIFCRSMGFPKLRFLQLARLPNFEKWMIEKGAMPNLSSLLISSCQKLQMIPDGLRFITTLKDLEIQRMPIEFNQRMQVIDGQEGADFDKVRHLHSIVIC